jgi:hypothetical protein
MLIEEQELSSIKLSIRIDERRLPVGDTFLQRHESQAEDDTSADLYSHLHLFEQIAPASFAEQYPRLMFCVVAATILLATVMAEVDCLRGSGYFWQ